MVRPATGFRDTQTGRAQTYDRVVRFGILGAFVFLFLLAFTKNINWDEFYFLSHVHAFLDGRLDRPLQTFFVRGFTWLDHVPGHEMGQILAARIVMAGLVCVTTAAIYRIAAHLTDDASARIAVLAFVTSGFVLPHGASFRADPIAAALLTTAFAVIMTTPMRLLHVAIVAALSGLALLVTIKSALYAPAFLAALLWRWQDKGVVLRTVLAGVLTIGFCAVLYGWHAGGIAAAPGNETATNVQEAATTGLLEAGFFPRASSIATWAILSIGPIVLACVGLGAVRNTQLTVLLILMATPLLSVVIYRNAFPYFFPFAVPLLMVAAAFGAQRLHGSAWLLRLVVFMIATGGVQVALTLTEGKAAQRATIAEVHRLFADPVPYIDDSSMIASFPSVAPFMSSWGMKAYRAAGDPIFGTLIETHKPPLLIANKWTLIGTMTPNSRRYVLPEDAVTLRQTYVHYRGPIWLAGREVTLSAEAEQLVMPFAGTYRVASPKPVIIDGQAVVDGDVVSLGRQITIAGPQDTAVKLIWDTGVPPLDAPLPTKGLYADFWAFRL